MHVRRRPSGIERRRLDFVLRLWLAEIHVFARFDERIVALHGGLQNLPVHRLGLILVLNRGGQLRKRIRAEEIAVRIDVRRRRFPTFALDGVGIEDRPYRSGGIVGRLRIFIHRYGGIKKIILARMVVDLLVVAIIVGRVGINVLVYVAVRVIAFGLVVEALADLVDQDEIVPILDAQTGRSHQGEK